MDHYGFHLNEKDFLQENHYSWDLAIIFPGDEGRTNFIKQQIEKIRAAGLNTFCYRAKSINSQDKTYIICKIRASLLRLKEHADSRDHKLILNEDDAKRRLMKGNKQYHIEPRNEIPPDPELCKYNPFEYIYGKYDTDNRLQKLYKPKKKDPLEPDLKDHHPFRSTIRIQLMTEILQESEEIGGANLDLRCLLNSKEICSFFPLPNNCALKYLQNIWLPIRILPWKQPLDHIKNYFGEAIALYFAFMGHYSSWLMPCACIGAALGIGTYSIGKIDSPMTAAYGVFIAMWGILMLEFWKRRQVILALEWGMTNFEEEQLDRPEFRGLKTTSPINGLEITYFPKKQRNRLIMISQSVILVFLLMVLGSLTGIVVLRLFFEQNAAAPTWGPLYGKYLCSTINAVQIQILNYIYKSVALRLNNNENHRTDIEFQDAMIAKLFLFQSLNSYISFIFIAFIQEPVLGYECEDGCLYTLMVNLIIIFGVDLLSGNFLEVVVPLIQHHWCVSRDVQFSPDICEREFVKVQYDEIMGTLTDYTEMAVQFGYMTLFVSAMPLTPLFGLINNWVEIRADAFKLMYVFQRPQPKRAQDIGTWMVIFQIMNVLSVISNSAIICFVMENVFSENVLLSTKLWIFILMNSLLLSMMFLLQISVRDVPAAVTLQLRRTDHIVSKLIARIADEDEDNFKLLENISDFEIAPELGAAGFEIKNG